jgi:hypothetical protein
LHSSGQVVHIVRYNTNTSHTSHVITLFTTKHNKTQQQ